MSKRAKLLVGQSNLNNFFLKPTDIASTSVEEVKSDQTENKKKYEAKRSRKFLIKWKEEYQWLENETGENEIMYCKICRQYPLIADKASSFYGGTNVFRRDGITSHDKSKPHLKCIGRHELEKCKAEASIKGETYKGPLPTAWTKLDENHQQQLVSLFNTAYFVAKHELSFLTYEDLINLQNKNEPTSFTCGYRNEHACRRFIGWIHRDIEQKIRNEVKVSNVFSILFDGSTDSSTKEIELVYVRVLDRSTGSPINIFFGLASPANANAEGILEAINGLFLSAGIPQWQEKLISMGSDGASVNIGKKKGVGALLANENKHVILLHCVAHRLELGILDVVKGHRLLKYMTETLFLLYKHYHYSPKALRELRTIAEAMNVTCLKPTRSSGTRWTPHMFQAIGILIRSFGTIMSHLENVSSSEYKASPEVKGRAKNIVQHLTDFATLKFAHFLVDVLQIIAELSLNFQRDNITLAGVLDCISTADMKLVELKVECGKHLKEFYNEIKTEHANDGRIYYKYKGIDLKNVTSSYMSEIENFGETKYQHDFIDKIIDSIAKRIENVNDLPVLNACAKILDPSEWPDDKLALATFGRKEIQTILNPFEDLNIVKNIDADQLFDREWPSFKTFVKKRHMHDLKKVLMDSVLKDRFKNLIILFEIIMVIPMSTAVCERGFSALKRIKSDWRSSLSVEMMNRLMTICTEGPSFEKYQARDVVINWWTGGKRQRRPNFSVTELESDSDFSDEDINYKHVAPNENVLILDEDE